jgi:16S rRNA (cytosine1402-N4)-methyltransferase
MQNIHTPVLIDRIITELENIWQTKIWDNKVFFDATFGGGGYTKKFLDKKAKVFACDKDHLAYEAGLKNFSKSIKFGKLNLVESDFLKFINTFDYSYFDLIVLDLGFSSNQLEFSGRGFSFLKEEDELDLRYNLDNPINCWQKIKKLRKPEELKKIIYSNSGEFFSSRIADCIYKTIRSQKNSEITTVGSIIKALDKEILHTKTAKQRAQILARVWQALRIWVNKELEILDLFLDRAVPSLKTGGILAVVSFHSLEDKIITKKMRQLSKPKEIDEFGNTIKTFNLLTPKPILPSDKELESNNRSRSAKLRILQKIVDISA